MSKRESQGRPPPTRLLRRLFDHQRWLNTDGRFGAQLVESELEIVNCDLAGVNFSRAEIDYAYFAGGTVKGATFRGTFLYNATFDACDVEDADFTDANLSWANFLTNHEKARLDGADVTRTAWNKAQMKQNDEDDRSSARRPRDKVWPRDNKIEPR
jgi:uncharacterized protein YjbI with pentapeptide repeats